VSPFATSDAPTISGSVPAALAGTPSHSTRFSLAACRTSISRLRKRSRIVLVMSAGGIGGGIDRAADPDASGDP
jgi:hypothetical protein